jgi:hypothetical protein
LTLLLNHRPFDNFVGGYKAYPDKQNMFEAQLQHSPEVEVDQQLSCLRSQRWQQRPPRLRQLRDL